MATNVSNGSNSSDNTTTDGVEDFQKWAAYVTRKIEEIKHPPVDEVKQAREAATARLAEANAKAEAEAKASERKFEQEMEKIAARGAEDRQNIMMVGQAISVGIKSISDSLLDHKRLELEARRIELDQIIELAKISPDIAGKVMASRDRARSEHASQAAGEALRQLGEALR